MPRSHGGALTRQTSVPLQSDAHLRPGRRCRVVRRPMWLATIAGRNWRLHWFYHDHVHAFARDSSLLVEVEKAWLRCHQRRSAPPQ
ncbi:MAG: hypothetical protein PVH86_12090 [Thiogranum sp.]